MHHLKLLQLIVCGHGGHSVSVVQHVIMELEVVTLSSHNLMKNGGETLSLQLRQSHVMKVLAQVIEIEVHNNTPITFCLYIAIRESFYII